MRSCSHCRHRGHNKSTCIEYINYMGEIYIDHMKDSPTSWSFATQMIDKLRDDCKQFEKDISLARESLNQTIDEKDRLYRRWKNLCLEAEDELELEKKKNLRKPMNDYIKKRMRNDLYIEARKNWQSNKTEDFKETTECPICYDDVEHDKMEFQPCGHHFCNDCLVRTFDKCAICRE